MKLLLRATVAVVALAGCASRDVAAREAPVVFGVDDREDWYEASDPAFADLLERATVVLVDPEYIDVTNPDDVLPDTITLGEYQGLCDGERFASQPAMGSCSGTLIDDDLVLTAAHCVDATVCADWYFVFDFVMEGPDTLRTITSDDVYRCAEIVVQEYTPDGEPVPWHDYAIVRLDRAVDAQRTPATVEMDPSTVGVGDAITVLGFGDGIPGKIHGGATVGESTLGWGYFIGSTDTFAGNSGSGTYDASHHVVGVFVRGAHDDYARRPGGCFAPNVAPDAEGSQEYDYASNAIEALCATGYESARLCGGAPPDAGPGDAGGAGPDAGPPVGSDGGGAPGDAGVATDAGAPDEGDDGCGCRAHGPPRPGPGAALALFGLLALRRRS